MRQPYLEVSFRHGRPLAAYLYLARKSDDRSRRTERVEGGVVIGYAADDRPIGLEFTEPRSVTVAGVNEVLLRLGQPLIRPEDLSPLIAA